MYTMSKTTDVNNNNNYLIKDNDKNITIGNIKNLALAEAITNILNTSASIKNQKRKDL